LTIDSADRGTVFHASVFAMATWPWFEEWVVRCETQEGSGFSQKNDVITLQGYFLQ